MISLIIPTKGRPEGLARLLRSIDIHLTAIICATKQSDLPSNILTLNNLVEIQFTVEDCSIIEAINKAARLSTNTFAVICDDMEFLQGALTKAINSIESHRVTGFMTANIPKAVPISFVGIDYYKSIGQLANPEYKHFYWDQELIDVASEKGKYRFVNTYSLLNHYHPAVTNMHDETHINKRLEKIVNDNVIYNNRKTMK